MGLGYYWSLANDSDLILGYRTSKISLKASNGTTTTVNEESINLSFEDSFELPFVNLIETILVNSRSLSSNQLLK
jgi:hypothetical protein